MAVDRERLTDETLDPDDWEAVRRLGHRMLDDALDYMRALPDRKVWQHAPPATKAHFQSAAPIDPQPAEKTYKEYLDHIRPFQLGNNHPRFWGWVGGTGTVMGMLADMLASSTNAISGGFAYMSNNYVELQVLDWCKALLGFPREASGLITSGGSASNLVGLAVARHARAGFDLRARGLHAAPAQMTMYCSDEGHASLQKAVELLGIGSDNLRRIPVNDSLQINVEALKAAIKRDKEQKLQPVCVVGACGATNTGAIDDLNALADICSEEGLWFHVDGAFGAWAAIAPESGHLVSGMERADSLAFDLHKWMYIPYPIGAVLVRDAEAHRSTFSLTPSYLAHGASSRGLTGDDVPHLALDYSYELSRGFAALRAWMSIKTHGTAKFGRVIQKNIDQAHYLAELVNAAAQLELALPVSLNVTCFRYIRRGLDDETLDKVNKGIEIELQERGSAVVSIVTVKGRKYLHAAITNHRSRKQDFDLLVRDVIRIGNSLP